MLTVIIPTLNAAEHLPALLEQINSCADEIIIIDGGSTDNTLEIAIKNGVSLAIAEKGRGQQLKRGAEIANGQWLLFLHADSVFDEKWVDAVNYHMQDHKDKAGYFHLKFQEKGIRPYLLSLWVRIRCLLFALPYGDQGLLIHKDLYQQIGGYPKQVLFEDVAIIKRLGRGRLRLLPAYIITSAKRYEREGYLKRGFKNLRLLQRYNHGENPEDLAREYNG